MKWSINDDLPIHTQLVDEIIKRIMNGSYKAGEKIPSVRELALEAKVNPNTMQKALVELEDKQIIYTQRTSGKYVTNDETLLKNLKKDMAQELVNKFISDIKELDFSVEEILDKIKKEMNL